MNAARRKELDKAFSQIEEAKSIIEAVKDEEQEAFDGMPENMQQGDRGSAMESAVSNLEDAIGEMENVLANIEDAKGQ